MTAMRPFDKSCLDGQCSEKLCLEMKRELGFFSFFGEQEMEAVSPFFNCRTLAERSILWQSGDPCGFTAFIVSGKVQIKIDTEFPGKQVVVGVFTRGAVIGANCAVGKAARNTTAMAMEDSGLILITHDNFEKLIADQPVVGVKLLRGMLLSETIRLQQAYSRLASIF